MSGVIYAAIVAMWLAFLVPMWLRRHDEAGEEARSVQTFSTAMRVLARRGPSTVAADGAASPLLRTDHDDLDEDDERDEEVTVGVALGESDHRRSILARTVRGVLAGFAVVARGLARVGRIVRRPSRRRTLLSAPARRRRVLTGLTTLTLAAAAAHVWTSLPLLYALVPASLLVLFLATLVISGRRARLRPRSVTKSRGMTGVGPGIEAERRGDSGEGLAYDYETRHDGETVLVRGFDRAPVLTDVPRQRARRTRRAPAAPASPATAPIATDAVATVETSSGETPVTDDFAGPRVGWQPVPVPTPTYVDAPTAPRRVRTINLAAPGAWTSGRLVADAVAAARDVGPDAAEAAGATPGSDDTEDTVGLELEQRRAVGD